MNRVTRQVNFWNTVYIKHLHPCWCPKLRPAQVLHLPLDMFKTFQEWCKYSSDCSNSAAEVLFFFDRRNIPSLSQAAGEELERPITAVELEAAVESLQWYKSRSRWFWFYKTFWKQLAPHLLETLTDSQNSGTLPPVCGLGFVLVLGALCSPTHLASLLVSWRVSHLASYF